MHDYVLIAPAAAVPALAARACARSLARVPGDLAAAGPPPAWPSAAAELLRSWLRLVTLLADRCQARLPVLRIYIGHVLARDPSAAIPWPSHGT